MGRWSSAALRGGGGAPGQTAPTPYLFTTDLETLEWTWTNPNPDHWRFDTSTDGVHEWEPDVNKAAVLRFYTPPPSDLFWRIAGYDAAGNRTTDYSNVVQTQII
jgi:hypothetical protein